MLCSKCCLWSWSSRWRMAWRPATASVFCLFHLAQWACNKFVLPEMSFLCDSYRSRDYHDDIGIRVLLSKTRVDSVGIRAYLTVARALELADRSRTLYSTLSTYYTSLSYQLLPLTHLSSFLDSFSYLRRWSFLRSHFWAEGSELGWFQRNPELHGIATTLWSNYEVTR